MCNAAQGHTSNFPNSAQVPCQILTPARRSVYRSTVATLTLNILSPSHYPGAPLSIGYLENLCHSASRHSWTGARQRHHRKKSESGKEERGSCTDSRDEARIEVQGYMSQRSPASGPPSNTPRQDAQSLPPLSPSLSRPQSAHNAPPSSPYTSQPATGPTRTTLPPLGTVNNPTNRLPPLLTDPGPSRPLGVHSILNPSYHGPQNPAPVGATGSSVLPPSPASRTAASILPQIAKRPADTSPAGEELHGSVVQGERRILTPKSPRLAAPGPGVRQSLPGLFSMSQSPLMRGESRMYPAEPGPSRPAEISSMPLATAQGRAPNTYPSLTESALGLPRRPSTGRNPFTASTIQTQTDSPSTSHSSYSHFSQSSPLLRYRQSSQNASSLQTAPGRQPVSLPPGQQSSTAISEGQYSMSKGSYGISIPTEGGSMLLPVEVDTEQASKTANEKRKRNAGASARFRQRRKEKEREAAETIDSLERNLRAIEQERNHYRSERDFFRDLYIRQVGPGQMPQRPVTPHAPIVHRPSLGDTSNQWQTISRETSEPLSRSIRRRTSYPATFPAPPPAASPMLPPQAQSFGFGPPQPQAPPIFQNPFTGPPRAPQGISPFPPPPPPPPQQQQQQQPPPPPPPQQQPPPPSPRSSSTQDPFHRDMYSRSWNPGP